MDDLEKEELEALRKLEAKIREEIEATTAKVVAIRARRRGSCCQGPFDRNGICLACGKRRA
jgi:hypothetical protein